MKPKFMEEYPVIKFVDMGVILGERWLVLGTEEKSKYKEMAQEDKQSFNSEMEEYSARRAAAKPPAPVTVRDRAAVKDKGGATALDPPAPQSSRARP